MSARPRGHRSSCRPGRREALLLLAGAACSPLLPAGSAAGPVPRPGPLTPALGNARGTRVLAVYFDYHCRYCRALDPLLPQLAGRNPELQILYKQYPILRPDSPTAAHIALAAHLRGRYFDAHARLLQVSGDYTGAVATDIARALGLDPSGFRHDMGDARITAELQQTADEADALGIHATPAILTSRALLQGGRTLEQLQSAVDALR